MGSFIPLSTNAGETLYAGHNPNADGMQNYPSEELTASFGTGKEWEVKWSHGLQRRAIDYMVSHPAREVELIPAKLLALMRGDSWAFDWLNQDPYPTLSRTWTTYISVVADLAWFSLLALTLVGVFGLGRAVWRQRLMVAITTSFVTLLVLYGFVYYGNYRYRLPYEPLMMVVAALVVDRGWQGLQAARQAEVRLEAGDADGGRATFIAGSAGHTADLAAAVCAATVLQVLAHQLPPGVHAPGDEALVPLDLLHHANRLGARVQEFTGVARATGW